MSITSEMLHILVVIYDTPNTCGVSNGFKGLRFFMVLHLLIGFCEFKQVRVVSKVYLFCWNSTTKRRYTPSGLHGLPLCDKSQLEKCLTKINYLRVLRLSKNCFQDRIKNLRPRTKTHCYFC